MFLFAFVIFLWVRLFFWEVFVGETTDTDTDDERIGDRIMLDPEMDPPFPPLPDIDFTINIDGISSEDLENSDIWDFTDGEASTAGKIKAPSRAKKARSQYVRKHSGGTSLLAGDADVNLGRVNLADTDVSVTKSGTFVLVEKEKQDEAS